MNDATKYIDKDASHFFDDCLILKSFAGSSSFTAVLWKHNADVEYTGVTVTALPDQYKLRIDWSGLTSEW